MERTLPLGRKDLKVFIASALRWNDIDLYGHVNNAVYFQLFDTAVCQWLIGAGLMRRANNNIFVAAHSSCDYFREVFLEDSIEVGLAIHKMGRSSVHYKMGLFRENEPHIMVQGSFVHVNVDLATRQPTQLSDDDRATLSSIFIPSTLD
ncbi:MAG: acyl-CoA thioesterase [Xanthobacteraceae bacterium]